MIRIVVMAQIKRWHDRHEFLVWIVLGVILLRIPSLLEPYWYGDEGIYLTLGMAIRKGVMLYSQIHDNKPPLLYLMAAAAGSLFWLRFVLLIWNAVNVVVVYKIGEKLFKRNWLICFVTVVFGLLTNLPWLEGNIANGEVFMIMPVAVAVLILISDKWTVKSLLGVGGLMAIGLLFKVPVVFDVVAIGLWMVFFQDRLVSIKGVKQMVWVMVGFLVPVLLSVGYFVVVGAGWEYVSAAFLQNIGYLASWRTGQVVGSGLGQSELVWRMVVAVMATTVMWVLTLKQDKRMRLIPVWGIWAIFGALLSERPYPHYLLQAVASVCLMVGVVIESRKIVSYLAGGLVLGLIVIGVVRYKFYFYPTVRYYENFSKYIIGKLDKKAYYDTFDSRVKQTYGVARYLKMRTTDGDRVFVWGDEPYIYALAERLPPGRFTVAYHIVDFDGREETIADIDKAKPKWIVVMKTEKREFRQLMAVLASAYTRVETIEGAQMWRRVE